MSLHLIFVLKLKSTFKTCKFYLRTLEDDLLIHLTRYCAVQVT